MDQWGRHSAITVHKCVVLALVGVMSCVAGCGDDDNQMPAASTATPTETQLATATQPPTSTSTPTTSATPTVTVTRTLTATATPTPPPAQVEITVPVDDQLSIAGSVAVRIQLSSNPSPGALRVTLDGVDVTSQLNVSGTVAQGQIANVAAGTHSLAAEFESQAQTVQDEVQFETVALTNPDDCEVLNNVECMLPYPSSRFLESADTPTGWRLKFPVVGMPKQFGQPISPDPYTQLDGFSPTVQILMHFPGGVDAAQSDAPRLLAATRSYGTRSLDADSPTVLLDVTAVPPVRVLHFIEVSSRASTPERQVVYLHPGRSLTPGHRYIVAVRDLVHPDGSAVEAEAAFAALRDDRPTDINAIESRREQFQDIFTKVGQAGIARQDLQLAFDFVVQSEHGLSSQMLSMRDQSFAWLAEQTSSTFSVEHVSENDCSAAGTTVWREVIGTYQVPLFLGSDPVTDPDTPAFLRVDSDGVPQQNGFTNPPFTIAIPCSALANGGTPKLPVILGHGLFGDGRGFVRAVAEGAGQSGIDQIGGATDWRGLSSPDISGADLPATFVGRVILNLRNFRAMPDRLRQGQLNTLVLAKMMKTAVFNADAAFKTPSGVGVFAGAEAEEFYLGGSLGGIMGLMFAALSPDVTNAAVVVPAINFSILLPRATPFIQFQGALELTGIVDPMVQALTLGITHELWVRGESAGYATHITSNPFPGTNAKHILMPAAYLDQQVTNQGTEIAARTLGLPSLIGSLQTDLAEIPDQAGPLASAFVMYDTGSFDLDNPAHAPFIPPLADQPPQPNRCDPHGLQSRIPAALEQLRAFLQPGGQIGNYCNGRCDAAESSEIPDGNDTPCDPLE